MGNGQDSVDAKPNVVGTGKTVAGVVQEYTGELGGKLSDLRNARSAKGESSLDEVAIEEVTRKLAELVGMGLRGEGDLKLLIWDERDKQTELLNLRRGLLEALDDRTKVRTLQTRWLDEGMRLRDEGASNTPRALALTEVVKEVVSIYVQRDARTDLERKIELGQLRQGMYRDLDQKMRGAQSASAERLQVGHR